MDIYYIIFMLLAITAVVLGYSIFHRRKAGRTFDDIRALVVSFIIVIVALFFMNVFVGFIV